MCRKTVLLCDDIVYNLIPLEAMLLTEWGIESELFQEGKLAIQCFKYGLTKLCCQRVFKLVLTDIQMPEMDGYELAS